MEFRPLAVNAQHKPLGRCFFKVRTIACLGAFLGLFAGCEAANQFQGKVVAGPSSFAGTVFANDSRLDQEGLPGARVRVTLDPQRLNAIRKQPVSTGRDGVFIVPTPETAGGLQTYRVEVTAEADGYRSALFVGDLPLPGQPFLIVLGQHGRGAPGAPGSQGGLGAHGTTHNTDHGEPSLDDIVNEAEKIERAYR